MGPFSPISRERQVAVTRSLEQADAHRSDYIVLIVRSCTIATFGLVLANAPVIAGKVRIPCYALASDKYILLAIALR